MLLKFALTLLDTTRYLRPEASYPKWLCSHNISSLMRRGRIELSEHLADIIHTHGVSLSDLVWGTSKFALCR